RTGRRARHDRRRTERPAGTQRRAGACNGGEIRARPRSHDVRHQPGRHRDRGAARAAAREGRKRAMSRSGWNDHEWQLIHTTAQSPALHMALDDVLTDEVSAGRRAPTLRVWEWAAPAVV